MPELRPTSGFSTIQVCVARRGNRYVADLFPGLRNVLAQVHSDANNEMGTENCIAALSIFKGGEDWMADPTGDVDGLWRERCSRRAGAG